MEPERHIEKLLRASAKTRRDKMGAPLELHPATRRLLQDEAARRAPRRGERGFFPTLLALLRRRLVLVSCAAAVVLAGAWVLLTRIGSKEEATLAFESGRDRRQAEAPARATAAEPAVAALDKEKSAGADSAVRSRNASRLERNLKTAGPDQNQPHEAAVPPVARVDASAVTGAAQPPALGNADARFALKPAEGRSLRSSIESSGAVGGAAVVVARNGAADFKLDKGIATLEEVPKSESAGDLALAVKAPAATALGVDRLESGQKRFAEKATGLAGSEPPAFAASQRFAQSDAASNLQYRDKNVPAPVLASFQVQPGDGEIRVVDQDGSVYRGSWRPESVALRDQVAVAQKALVAPATPPALLQEEDARLSWSGEPAAQNYFFRVAGMNQSLKQNVVFTGNLAVTNGMPLVQSNVFGAGGRGVGGFQNAVVNQSLQFLLSNSRISGTAVIDNTNEIIINAVPVAP